MGRLLSSSRPENRLDHTVARESFPPSLSFFGRSLFDSRARLEVCLAIIIDVAVQFCHGWKWECESVRRKWESYPVVRVWRTSVRVSTANHPHLICWEPLYITHAPSSAPTFPTKGETKAENFPLGHRVPISLSFSRSFCSLATKATEWSLKPISPNR